MSAGLPLLAKKIRRDIVEMAIAAGRGHIASAFSLVEMLLVLYENILHVSPDNPNDPDRDRLILSKGHGCLALYAILAHMGFFPRDELWRFGQVDSILGGHPERSKIPGVEASTGALGHGLSIGVGIALAAKMDERRYRTFVIVGDGECNEGTVWEAALSAAKHQLGALTVLVDYNKMQSYGRTSEVLELEPFADKWQAFGFRVFQADMNAPEHFAAIMASCTEIIGRQPNAIICHTVKGKGVSFVENNPHWHHRSRLSDDEIHRLRAELNRVD